jgi:hypothetical protein
MKMMKQLNTTEALERKTALEVELERILPIIINQNQPEKIILFGSLATGEVHEGKVLYERGRIMAEVRH